MVPFKLISFLGLSVFIASIISFVLFDTAKLEILVRTWGLPILVGALGCWVYCFFQASIAKENKAEEPTGLKKCFLRDQPCTRVRDLTFILLVTIFVHLSQTHDFKVVMDEVNSVNASRAIFEHQQIFAPGALDFGYDDFRLSTEGYVDKRPFLFPFAVSLLHFLTGYRPTNGFFLNILLTPVLIGCILAVVRCYVRRPLVGYLAVLLFVSFPFVARVMTSSGAELLNTTLLALLILAAINFFKRPTKEHANLMFSTACVLAYARYESVAYVFAAGLIWSIVCFRERQLFISKITCLFPLFLVPLVWIQRIVQSKSSDYFQHAMLGKGRTFSAEYFGDNIDRFFRFLFEPQWLSLNAPLTVSILAIVLIIVSLRSCGVGPVRHRSALVQILSGPLFWIGLIAVALQGLLLFYLWGDMNDPVVTRIGMPFFLMFVLFATALWGAEFSDRVKSAPIIGVAGLCLWFGIFAKADGLVEETNYHAKLVNQAGVWVSDELDWRDVVYSNNVQILLPYRVRVFPELNLRGSFRFVDQMRAAGLINRVYLLDKTYPGKEPDQPSRRYKEFLQHGGSINLVRHMNVGPGYKLTLYELDFTHYTEGDD